MEQSKEYTALVVLNYNNFEDTINCIQSVEHYNTAPVKFVVVDNGSTRKNVADTLGCYLEQHYSGRYLHLDDSGLSKAVSVKRSLPYATYIQSAANDGYACGNNKALCLVECDDSIRYVMILNNDVLFVQDIVPILAERYDTISDAGILSPILYKRNMEGLDLNCARKNVTLMEIVFANYFHYILRLLKIDNPFSHRYIIKNETEHLPKCLEIELPSGSCMFIDKKYFSSIGFFDSHTFLYYEENILFKKIEKTGKRNYLMTDLKCIHLGAQSTSSSPGRFGIICSNASCRYYMKNYHGISKLSYLFFLLSQKFGYAMFCLQQKLKR